MAVILGQALEDIYSGTKKHMARCFRKVYMEIQCVSYTQCSARHYKQERPRVSSILLKQLASEVIPRLSSEIRQD